jgi:hypothetical protein
LGNLITVRLYLIESLFQYYFLLVVQSSLVNNKQAVRHHPFKFIHSGKSLSSSVSTTSTGSQNPLPTPQITQEKKDNKKKRYIDDDQLDELFDSENDEVDSKLDNIDHTLHAKVQETSAKIHDNADSKYSFNSLSFYYFILLEPIDTDDSKVFSDIKMTPNELTDVRRRRDIKLNEETNRRRKRALSPYDFYDTDSVLSKFIY